MIVRETKDAKVQEIRNAAEAMVVRLDAQLKLKLMTLMRHKTFLAHETEQLEGLVQEIDRQMSTSSRSQLINKSAELLKSIFQVQLRSTTRDYANLHVPPDFTSEIVPPYDTCTFRIERFTQLQLDGVAVYSNPLLVNGMCWRLKIYPSGNGPARGEHLSVFLELSSGHPGTNKYEYRVQMLHADVGKEISREFVSDFEIGECWGYNRFFPLDLLASEGYLDTQRDLLGLRFQVRPSTYYQRCRDQQYYINQLLRTHQQQAAHIKELQEQNQILSKKSASPTDSNASNNNNEDDSSKVNGHGSRKLSELDNGPRSLPPLSGRARAQGAIRKTAAERSDTITEANDKIFTEILMCLSPNNGSTGLVKRPNMPPRQTTTTSSSSSVIDDHSPSTNCKRTVCVFYNSNIALLSFPFTANMSMDLVLLTESSDDEDDAVVVGAKAENPARQSQITSADHRSEGLSESYLDEIDKRYKNILYMRMNTADGGGASGVQDDDDVYNGEDTPTGENFGEYGEVSVAVELAANVNKPDPLNDSVLFSRTSFRSRPSQNRSSSNLDGEVMLLSLLEELPSSASDTSSSRESKDGKW